MRGRNRTRHGEVEGDPTAGSSENSREAPLGRETIEIGGNR